MQIRSFKLEYTHATLCFIIATVAVAQQLTMSGDAFQNDMQPLTQSILIVIFVLATIFLISLMLNGVESLSNYILQIVCAISVVCVLTTHIIWLLGLFV
ncbi:hypothetical protein COB55_02135 [Candidatus Wolfebacteria bacterium]|nr:MAG: hypothetical protein COB55_02135 [Candidatus Wolfebacteria bacterium]